MKKLLLVALASTAAYGAWHWHSTAPSVAHDASLVRDRIWIDHLPRNDRDTINVFAALTEESFGVFQATSQWKGEFELFRYEGHGDELRLVFPQTGTKEKVVAKARTCNENGMDFCLEMSGGSHGVKRYYSREGWEIGSVRDAEDLATHLTAR